MLSLYHKGGRNACLETVPTNLDTENTPKASRKVKFPLGRAKREPFLLYGIIRSVKEQRQKKDTKTDIDMKNHFLVVIPP